MPAGCAFLFFFFFFFLVLSLSLSLSCSATSLRVFLVFPSRLCILPGREDCSGYRDAQHGCNDSGPVRVAALLCSRQLVVNSDGIPTRTPDVIKVIEQEKASFSLSPAFAREALSVTRVTLSLRIMEIPVYADASSKHTQAARATIFLVRQSGATMIRVRIRRSSRQRRQIGLKTYSPRRPRRPATTRTSVTTRRWDAALRPGGSLLAWCAVSARSSIA